MKLILTADDYNGDSSINSGIHQAIEAGVISTVSAFSNTPDALNNLIHLNSVYGSRLGIGAHLSITSGIALTGDQLSPIVKRNPSNDTFQFLEMNQLTTKGLTKALIKNGILAQLDVFRQAGIDIDHITVHQGALLLVEEWMQALQEVSTEFYPDKVISQRSYLRTSVTVPLLIRSIYEAYKMNRQILKNGFGILAKNGFSEAKRLKKSKKYFNRHLSAAHSLGIKTPNPMIDAFYGNSTGHQLNNLLKYLPNRIYNPNSGRYEKTADTVTYEICLHLADAAVSNPINGVASYYFKGQKKELQTLLKNLPKLLHKYNLDKGNFSDLSRLETKIESFPKMHT